MPRYIKPEFYAEHQSPVSAENQRQRQDAFVSLLRLEPAVLNDVLPSTGILGPGRYAGAAFSSSVHLSALGPSISTGEVNFKAGSSGIILGVIFKQPITIQNGVNVQFNGCVFQQPITVVSGGKVVCSGCRFDGDSAILNAGVNADAASVGCVKTSATSHTNTTIIGEVT